MERHEIEAFLTLAEELHFGRTTERLGLSQGRVSQTIKKLERRIGAQLFERTSRRVVLTPIGHQLRDDLLPAHRQIRLAVDKAIATARGITGELRVGFSAAWNGELIVAAADAFTDRHPGCEIRIQEVPFGDPLEKILRKELDVQLSVLPAAESSITVDAVLFREPRALVVPACHPFAERESLSLDDLADIPLITPTGRRRYWLDHHYPHHTPSGRPIPRGPATSGWQEILSLVSAGKGASPSCTRAARYHTRPDIAFVPFHDAPTVDFALLWPTTAETATVRAFTQTVLDLAETAQRFTPDRFHADTEPASPALSG